MILKSIKEIAIILIIFITIVLALEGLTRLFMPQVNFPGLSSSIIMVDKYGFTYGHRPHAEGISWGASVYTDEFGFRSGPEMINKANALLPSIVVLGDSVAFGTGVSQEYTFFNLISDKLRQYNFYNTSATGYGITNYKNIVDNFIIPNKDKFKIKEVVLFFTLNDIDDKSSAKINELLNGHSGVPEYKGMIALLNKITEKINFNVYLSSRSKLYLVIKSILYNAPKVWALWDMNLYNNEQIMKNLSEIISYINNTLKKEDIKFFVFVIPYEYQLRQNSKDVLFPQAKISDELSKEGINFYDLYPLLRDAMKKRKITSREMFIFNDHCHLSVKGNAIVAEEILKILEK